MKRFDVKGWQVISESASGAWVKWDDAETLAVQAQRDYQLATEWKARATELEVELGVRTTQYETAVRDVAHERQMRGIMAHTIAKCESELTQLRAELDAAKVRAEVGEHPSEPTYEDMRRMVEYWREACQKAEATIEAERADHDEFGQYTEAKRLESECAALRAELVP